MSEITSIPFKYIGKTKLGKIFRPYLLLQVFSKKTEDWQFVEMLIDTGADYSLFPKRHASVFGIDLSTDCHPETTIGVGGPETVYQYKKLPIKISHWEKTIPVGFLERDDIPPILGRLSALEDLKLVMTNFRTVLEN